MKGSCGHEAINTSQGSGDIIPEAAGTPWLRSPIARRRLQGGLGAQLQALLTYLTEGFPFPSGSRELG